MTNSVPEVTTLVLGPLQTNCYLLRCPETGATLVIDPADSPDRILQAAGDQGAHIEQILLTHAHTDHLAGLPGLRQATGAKVLLHRLDVQLLQQYGRFYGVRADQYQALVPHVQLNGGEEITVGHFTGTILATPGHTPGGVTLKVDDLLFTGDTLFAMGVGRVDLPGGSPGQLLQSIQQLFTLPDECTIYPGHGPASTIGAEKRDNPYV